MRVRIQNTSQLGLSQITDVRSRVDPPHDFRQSEERLTLRTCHGFAHDDAPAFDEKEEGARAVTTLISIDGVAGAAGANTGVFGPRKIAWQG